jgi:hypothetical protein
MVVEEVDSKKKNNVEDPAAYGNLVRREEEATVLVKLSDESCHSDKEELDKCQKSP